MASGPSNAASVKVTNDTPSFGDRQFVETKVRSLVTDDFVREDRRPVIGVPTVGPDGWVEQLLAFFDLGVGQPTTRVGDVVAVRGERLALYWIEIEYSGGATNSLLAIVQYDDAIELMERFMTLPDDDPDVAIEVLDEMFETITEE